MFQYANKKEVFYTSFLFAEGRTRTGTWLPTQDFESSTSTNFITSAHYLVFYEFFNPLNYHNRNKKNIKIFILFVLLFLLQLLLMQFYQREDVLLRKVLLYIFFYNRCRIVFFQYYKQCYLY